MSQESRAVSDLDTGGWSVPPIFSKINDDHSHDDTYVGSPGKRHGDAFIVRLKPLNAPDGGDQTLTVRMQKVGTGSEHAWISLLQIKTSEPTIVVAARRVDPTPEFADYALTLSSDEAKRITDYASLCLRVTAVRDESSSSGMSGSVSHGSTSGGSASGGSVSEESSSGGSTSGGGTSSGSTSGYSNSGSSVPRSSSGSSQASTSSSQASTGSDSSSGSASFSKGTSSGGSSSGSMSYIQTTCCGRAIPATLFATFDNILSGLGVVVLTYDFNSSQWVGSAPGCGGTVFVDFACVGGKWTVAVSGSATGFSDNGMLNSCDPLNFVSFIFVNGGCGTDLPAVAIVE